MRISDLWGKHTGQDIYIVGTGPSLRCFPLTYLSDKITIGLNQAWKHLKLTYSITVHPELIRDDYLKVKNPNQTTWIVKKKPPMQDLQLDDPRFFVFLTDQHPHESNPKYIRKKVPDKLYQGRGIQQTAMNLAAHMGAKSIILVGVDMTDLLGDHHAHDQHTQFHGLSPDAVYQEYRKYTSEVRKIIRDELQIPVLTLSPFLGAGFAEEDYKRLCIEMNLSQIPTPKDTSKYRRRM